MTADHEPAGSPVTAVRRASRGPSAGLVLIAVVAAVVAAIVIAVGSGPGPQPAQSASPLALVTASPAPSAASTPRSPVPPSAAPTPSPAPEVTTTVVVLRDVSDPAGELATLTGCAESTHTTRYPFQIAIKGEAVDSVAEAAGRSTGWLFVPPGIQASTRVWLGADLVDLALAVGQQVVAVGPKGEVWLGGPSGATRWFPIATPKGLTAWVMGGETVVGRGTCDPWTVPVLIGGQRSVTCRAFGVPVCLRQVGQVRLDIADFAFRGGDLVIARTTTVCPPLVRACRGDSVLAIATSPGWPLGEGVLQTAMASSVTGQFTVDTSLTPAEIVVRAVAQPSLPLPTGGGKARLNDCSETLTGPLRGLPWDPRVAWVGNLGVAWPSGTTASFMRGVTVDVVSASEGTVASEGDSITLTGMLDETGTGFNACAMSLASAARLNAPGAIGEVPAVTPGPLEARGTGS